MSAHQQFTVSNTAYLRNLDKDDLRATCVAVHHQNPPKDLGDGRASISLRFPVLLVSAYLVDAEEFAQKVAQILEKHWDDAPDATTQSYDAELLTSLERAVSVLDAAAIVWMGSDRASAAIAKARGRSPQPATNCAPAAEAG